MATPGIPGSTVMGPEGSVHGSSTFTEKLPPSFDGHSNYSVYRQDVELWLCFTSLDKEKQGPALIGRLSGEAKASAKTLSVAVITGRDGADKILQHLDKSYAIDATDQLDIDLATFLDYSWKNHMPVEQFIAGFHSRLDRVASLNMDAKLKGHLLLRQAGLDMHTRNMIVGASSGKYDVPVFQTPSARRIATTQSPRQWPHSPKMSLSSYVPFAKKKGHIKKELFQAHPPRKGIISGKGTKRCILHLSHVKYGPFMPCYSGFRCLHICCGKDTLDLAMKQLGLDNVGDASPKLQYHRFGNYEENQKSLFAVLFPFEFKSKDNKTLNFKIHFDVIDGSLPFLIGFPSLKAMGANLNFASMTLGINVSDGYHKIQLEHNQHHLYLPFRLVKRSYGNSKKESYYSPGQAICAPSRPRQGYSRAQPNRTEMFDPGNLRKLHLQMRHGTHSAMRNWIQSAGKWSPELDKCITELLLDCECKIANMPKPHAVASTRPPETEKQTAVALDVVFFEGVPCLHVVDKCTEWSEAAVLRSRAMSEQLAAFQRIQVLRHGNPQRIYGDREYLNRDFTSMCSGISAEFIPVAANDHEANGTIERANRTLRNFFMRTRAENQKSSIGDILAEATFGKNICVGSKAASSFDLLYGHKPRLMDSALQPHSPPVSISEHVKKVASQRINRMLRSNIRRTDPVKVGDYVYYWRDNARWLGPARVVDISDHIVTVIHDEQ